MAAHANDIRARVDSTWAPFRAAVTAMGDALDEPTAGGWTAKEMLAHVAFWDEAVVPVVVRMIRGQELPADWAFGSGDLGLGEGAWREADVHNAREATWARSRSAAEVIERCDRAHRQLVGLLATVTDEEVMSHPEYFSDLGNHYGEHLQELGLGPGRDRQAGPPIHPPGNRAPSREPERRAC